MYEIKILNAALPFNPDDADQAEALENALQALAHAAVGLEQQRNTLTASAYIRKYFAIHSDFFNAVFSPDASGKIFADQKTDMTVCETAFDQFIDALSAVRAAALAKHNAHWKKYLPESND